TRQWQDVRARRTRGGQIPETVRRHLQPGTVTMPVLSPTASPTWTDERIERLKQHFEAGLSCREIAADIGVSRNAVIGKLSRLNLMRGRTIDDRQVQDRVPAPSRTSRAVPRLQYEMLATTYGETGTPMVNG